LLNPVRVRIFVGATGAAPMTDVATASTINLGRQIAVVNDYPGLHAATLLAPLPARAYAISKSLIERVRPAFNAETGARLAETRKRIPRWKPKRIARQAARARWKRLAHQSSSSGKQFSKYCASNRAR
jgi:hypothetical protein